jgi:glyoxylase-like metal-dependent hydrolase (beta-lactamase superfamily II)
MRPPLTVLLAAGLAACGRSARGPSSPPAAPPPPPPAAAAVRWCDQIPRPPNAALPKAPVATDWFDVRQVTDGVYALIEPLQFQEAISYLILGRDRALLFDSGIGLVPIRPVVERLTRLPVEVLNSHTHYDHVGGNAEFERILARDTPYTRANTRGFGHAELAGEVAATSFCGGAPSGVDTAGFRTRAWRPTRIVAEGDTISLGGRTLEILSVPGHTPDALALLDRANGLLWTGDTFYEGWIWLYVPETDLDAYQRSIDRLASIGGVRRLLPAHNTATADPAGLARAADAIRKVRAGSVPGVDQGDNRIVFQFDGFGILTSKPLLRGEQGDRTRGGSGLTVWR